MVLLAGARGELNRSAMVANGQTSVLVEGPDDAVTSVMIRDSVIRDTRLHPTGQPGPGTYREYFGWSIAAVGNAEVDVVSSSLLRSGGASVVSAISPAIVRLSDSAVVETKNFPDGRGNAGAAVQTGGRLELTRSAIIGASSIGVLLVEGSLSLDGSLIADTRTDELDRLGHAIQASSLSTIVATRSALLRNVGSGILMGRMSDETEAPGTLSFRDGIIADNPGYADGTFGRALDIGGGAMVEVLGSAIHDNRQIAVLVAGQGTLVQVLDSVLRDTHADGQGHLGRAFNLQEGARVEIEGTLIRDQRDVSLVVAHPGSSLSVRESQIIRTGARHGWRAALRSRQHRARRSRSWGHAESVSPGRQPRRHPGARRVRARRGRRRRHRRPPRRIRHFRYAIRRQ